MRVRREVLGDAHVDRATAAAGDRRRLPALDHRDGVGRAVDPRRQLDRRTRSCVTIAVLTALRAEDELALHIRAGRRNGLTPHEIAEVIMHTAGYAGIPAANSAMAVAKQVLAERLTSRSGRSVSPPSPGHDLP